MIIPRPDIDKKFCFILMPFTEQFDRYYFDIIKPVVMDAGLRAIRGDEIYGTHTIILDIWNSILKARLVIADVTTKNPNVNYELGLCHAIGVPTILIASNIDDIPFDYRHHRCIIYNTESSAWEEKLKIKLKRTLEVALTEEETIRYLPFPTLPPKYPAFINPHLVGWFMVYLLNIVILYLAKTISLVRFMELSLFLVVALTFVVLSYARRP